MRLPKVCAPPELSAWLSFLTAISLRIPAAAASSFPTPSPPACAGRARSGMALERLVNSPMSGGVPLAAEESSETGGRSERETFDWKIAEVSLEKKGRPTRKGQARRPARD